ncbi:hypothetical protein DICVIV_09049 [Dictyocaulus viviparus]|uniref:Uncharacterized protein n=1 Tax=Dictyocaulus viviparus TaxID=29172 RepID=A0A0D8XRB9_DICVI|nr:hypothetical protein DICVIV_09049 [Dictyocaulus viviparus]
MYIVFLNFYIQLCRIGRCGTIFHSGKSRGNCLPNTIFGARSNISVGRDFAMHEVRKAHVDYPNVRDEWYICAKMRTRAYQTVKAKY